MEILFAVGYTLALVYVIWSGHRKASNASLRAMSERYAAKLVAAKTDDDRREVMNAYVMFIDSRLPFPYRLED